MDPIFVHDKCLAVAHICCDGPSSGTAFYKHDVCQCGPRFCVWTRLDHLRHSLSYRPYSRDMSIQGQALSVWPRQTFCAFDGVQRSFVATRAVSVGHRHGSLIHMTSVMTKGFEIVVGVLGVTSARSGNVDRVSLQRPGWKTTRVHNAAVQTVVFQHDNVIYLHHTMKRIVPLIRHNRIYYLRVPMFLLLCVM